MALGYLPNAPQPPIALVDANDRDSVAEAIVSLLETVFDAEECQEEPEESLAV
jgi:hypothetical protein